MSLECVILAGGASTRFPSPLPKVVYPFLKLPLIEHLLHTIVDLPIDRCALVTGSRSHEVCVAYENDKVFCCYQVSPKGTWDALMTALPHLKADYVLVINADMPLISKGILTELISQMNVAAALVSTNHPNPSGYGRIICNQEGDFQEIVEEKEANIDQKAIHKINAGVYLFSRKILLKAQKELQPSKSGEYYLTSLWSQGLIPACETKLIDICDHRFLVGINTWSDFELAVLYHQQIQRERLVEQGAILHSPAQIMIEGEVSVKGPVTIEGPCLLKGPLILEAGSDVGPFSYIHHASLGKNTKVQPFSMVQDTFTQACVSLGPFLRTSEGAYVDEGVCLGNFVETKRCTIGAGTKSKHFSYISDTTIGSNVNIGAFVSFCNYNGKIKQHVRIGDRVFIGSSSQLVAPLIIDSDAFIGAGTTVTKNIPAHALVTRRAELKIKQGTKSCVESLAESPITK